jgi:hypothetical protein
MLLPAQQKNYLASPAQIRVLALLQMLKFSCTQTVYRQRVLCLLIREILLANQLLNHLQHAQGTERVGWPHTAQECCDCGRTSRIL